MSGSSGRGPTIDMSPRSTLKSCGSSSILVRRNRAPSGNTRGSSCPVMRLARPGRRWCMVRSLYMVKGAPARPTRRARYSTGPGLARRIPSAAIASTGATSARPTPESTTSRRRLTMAVDLPHGHEHFRGLHAALLPPSLGAIAQGLERSRVRIGAQLGLVARHRGDLGLERLADVHPGIRHEAAREGPLSAARGVERVHGPDTILRRSRCDEGRLEEQLVVAIDVATVLAVDHVGPELAHDLLEQRDHALAAVFLVAAGDHLPARLGHGAHQRTEHRPRIDRGGGAVTAEQQPALPNRPAGPVEPAERPGVRPRERANEVVDLAARAGPIDHAVGGAAAWELRVLARELRPAGPFRPPIPEGGTP